MSASTPLDVIHHLPCWSGSPTITPLSGGMTNRNYRVRDSKGQYAVRLGHDLPEHGVMRFNELAVAKAAHAAGLSPEVIFAGEGVLVSRFIEGRTLGEHDIANEHNMLRVLEMVQAFHRQAMAQLRGPVLMFWVFHVIRHYGALLQAAPFNPLAQRLPALLQKAQALEDQLGPVDIVLGHNDLLAANILDDGQRLWLIDFDYAGLNSPLFDLANLSSNNGFSAEQDLVLLERYFGAGMAASQRQGFQAMKQASLLREAMWGAVSQIHSRIEFDYAGYTQGYLDRLDYLG
jgi:thiamine kinase-like enzyme